MKILIYGLSGAGKSTLTTALKIKLGAPVVNGDDIRHTHNDWDFSIDGRMRQAYRIAEYANTWNKINEIVLVDIIAPLQDMREIVDPDFSILMDTISTCKYEDTNNIFDKGTPDLTITSFEYDIDEIVESIQKFLKH